MVLKKKKAASKKKKTTVKIALKGGILSYPYLSEPDSGRENSDDKFKTDYLMDKKDWKTNGKEIREAVLTVGRKFYKDKSLELSDFANPFRDTDKLKKYSDNALVKGKILIRAKTQFKPMVVDAQKEELSEDEIRRIKGGDYANIVVAVYPYSNGEGGVTCGLNLVQYLKPGPTLGVGAAANLAMIDEIEVEPDDMDVDDEDESEDEDEAPAPKKKAKKSAPVEDDEDEEDEEEEETEDDEPEEEESEDDEEEDEPAPKKKGKSAKKAPAKKSKKSEPEDDEEEESEDDDDDFNFDADEDE